MDQCEEMGYRREALILRLAALVLLAFTAISHQSYFHLILFVISLCLNAAFAFHRIFVPAIRVVNLAIACLALHLFLLLLAQITYIQINLNISFKRILGLSYFFCSSDISRGCEEPSWNVYVGVATELCLTSLLFGLEGKRKQDIIFTDRVLYQRSANRIDLHKTDLFSDTNFNNFLGASLSVMAKFCMDSCFVALIFINWREASSIYISGLTNFQGIMFEKFGLHSGVGLAAFYPLLIKILLCIPFYMIRYFDGRRSETPSTFENIKTSRITDASLISMSITTTSLENISRLQWVIPYICLFTYILYICLYYMYILIHGDWLALSNNEWLSPAVRALISSLSLPFCFMFLLICVHIKRYSTLADILWRPTSVFSRILATSYDILIAISLCCFASYDLSISGIILLVLSLMIFITTGQRCKTDHNVVKWLGFGLNQTWPIVILLLIISMRSAFSTERSKWLIEMQRSDAEEDAVSLLKFLSKNWMYKFGVEMATKLIWSSYTNLTLIILILEYLSALGLPHQFSQCHDYFWNKWSAEGRKFFIPPFSTSLSPTFVADYVLLLLILIQKDVFNGEKEHLETDNTPLSEGDFNQPIPALYSDFISTKGRTNLVYDVICFVVLIYQMRVFNSWYFQFVIMDYRADMILGSRGGELLLELRKREAQRIIDDCKTISGYYHQVSERFFPLSSASINFEQEQTFSLISHEFKENVLENNDAITMVEKTVEVLDSVRVTAMHIFQLLNNPEWLYRISKGDAFVSHVLDKDKNELSLRGDFQSVAYSELLWNEALNEYHAIHPAFKFLYCFSHSIIAQSELICFTLMLIVHLSKSCLITFPLPLMVFFWGVLAIPRPSKSFWLVTAFYIQFIIIFRLLFCNELILTLISEKEVLDNNPFSIRRLLAMNPNINGPYWDIALLAMSASCEKFCEALLMRKVPSSMDWYPWMVGCDVSCLILISFFYSMMGHRGSSGNVLLDVQVSRLPRWFAYTLISVFVIMIVDRWLYLSKQIKFRHIVTWKSISLYLIKSAYLLMSAWHMRNGYPSVINRDILGSGSGVFRLIILKIYLNIPFLFELRTAMDWTFTSTALTMADFIRMENYYNEIEGQHCWILFDHWLNNYFPTRRGRPTPTSGNFGTRAPPKSLRFVASIEGYPALYSTDAAFNGETMSHLSKHNMQALTVRIVFEMSLLRPVGCKQRSHDFILATVLTSMQSKIFLDLINGNISTARMSFPIAQFLLAPPNGYLLPVDVINLPLKRIHSVSTWQYHGDYWSVTWDQKFIIFVDRVMPSLISIIVGSGGMVAMYIAVILVVGRFVRELVRTPIHKAVTENIPNCENLLRLFHDIYVVREKRKFYLESRLYGKLIF
ncbi:hypothetical protein DINM_022116 [Dirofilaria immitis]|nr:hypothetical protein [Dirofilaria immitis]